TFAILPCGYPCVVINTGDPSLMIYWLWILPSIGAAFSPERGPLFWVAAQCGHFARQPGPVLDRALADKDMSRMRHEVPLFSPH
ncbi:hypothetical protein, partial [Aeromonas caviae]|uniref:hypothetical protein n=1 Tax=Aeromonas caviae TaxID=648 RepID=UPI001F17A93B